VKRCRKFHTQLLTSLVLALFLSQQVSTQAVAQTEDSFGDADADPIKLFEQGQAAHSRGEFERALAFYERAIKVRPEFPEAEFQRANALVSLGRYSTAHLAFERTIELRKEWSMPYSAHGALYVREGQDEKAEKSFRQALAIDSNDNLALRMLAEIRLRQKDPAEALRLSGQATREENAPVSAWIVRAMAERATGDKKSAHKSLEVVLQAEPENTAGLVERAELWIADANYERAAIDLNRALKSKPEDKGILARLAFTYEQAGDLEESRRVAEKAGLLPAVPAGTIHVIGTAEEIEAANSEDVKKSRNALEKLLEKNPKNAMLLARLGASYRTESPARSAEYYRQAAELQPENEDYVVGYAAAMVQARRFPEAVSILRRVIRKAPEHEVAHANLATALYELKLFNEALPEYQWLLRAKPENAVTHYFIATCHDHLGEYQEALNAYELFLTGADSRINQLEIDKVKLRLPSLRRQIKLGEGVKKKKS
jgi:tetratricopeptide (TPR) repeat protein